MNEGQVLGIMSDGEVLGWMLNCFFLGLLLGGAICDFILGRWYRRGLARLRKDADERADELRNLKIDISQGTRQ